MDEGRVGGGEGREIMGQSVQGLMGHREDFAFFSLSEVGSTEDFEQRREVPCLSAHMCPLADVGGGTNWVDGGGGVGS